MNLKANQKGMNDQIMFKRVIDVRADYGLSELGQRIYNSFTTFSLGKMS